MIAHNRKPVCLSLISTDLPVGSVLETAATLYQKETNRFHLLLKEPPLPDIDPIASGDGDDSVSEASSSRLLWLEISPHRVIMTMQGNQAFSYRHLWQQHTYGLSRYWLRSDDFGGYGQIRLRNFNRTWELTGSPLPSHLRIEYELWSDKLPIGCYVLNLEIHH